jgi:hypothetical protein
MEDKTIEYKGYLIEKFTWGRRQYDYFLSKDGVDIKYAQLIPYINLEPSIYNKKQGGCIMRTIGTLLMVVSMSLIFLGIPIIHYTG